MSIAQPLSSAPGLRKEKHLEICTDPSRFAIEGGGAGFEGIRFIHEAMPEISASEVDPGVDFLGVRLPHPMFISCMTGGSQGGFEANRLLARAARALGIPLGLGSIRVLFREPALFDHFHVKPIAGDVPVLANIGAVQVRDLARERIFECLRRLEVQALVVHVNPGQELFQPDGDTDFRGLKEALFRLLEESPLPVIVKETGFGIRPGLARELLDAGAAYIDLAGSGGTNWVSVESYRREEDDREAAEELRDWGIPTALLVTASRELGGRVIASGGMRSGLEAAKAAALGAEMVGFALPVIRAVRAGGVDAVIRQFHSFETSFRAAMVLTGSKTLDELRRGTVWMEPAFSARVSAFSEVESALHGISPAMKDPLR